MSAGPPVAPGQGLDAARQEIEVAHERLLSAIRHLRAAGLVASEDAGVDRSLERAVARAADVLAALADTVAVAEVERATSPHLTPPGGCREAE